MSRNLHLTAISFVNIDYLRPDRVGSHRANHYGMCLNAPGKDGINLKNREDLQRRVNQNLKKSIIL